MDRGAHGDDLVRIHVSLGLLLEVLLHCVADHRKAGRAAHQDHPAQIPGDQVGLLQRFIADLEGALDQVRDEGGVLVPRDGSRDGAGLAVGAHRDVGDADLDLLVDGESLLGALCGDLELLQRIGIVAEIDSLPGHELVCHQIDQSIVEVLASEVGVSAGREDLEHVLPDLENRDVEGPPAQVVDGHPLGEAKAEAVGESGRGGLVQKSQHLEAGDPPGVLGGLSLVVVEVGGNRDHRLLRLLAELLLGDRLHLPKHHGRDLGEGELLIPDLDAQAVIRALDDAVGVDRLGLLDLLGEVVAADQALRGRHRVHGVVDDVGLGGVSHRDAAVLVEGHHAGRHRLAVGVL